MTALSVANAELQRSFGLLQVTRAGLRRAADALVSFRKNLLAPVGPIALPERWAEALALVRGCFSSAVYGGKSLFDDVGGGFPAASVMARLEAAMAGPAEQQAREVNAVVQGVEQWIKAVERDMGDITHQLERNSQVIDRLSHGLGSLVDVDLDAEAAQLKALQVQQQLSKSGVGLGNGVPSTLLALFR
jgi:flagellin-like hook-associated protein FlgL